MSQHPIPGISPAQRMKYRREQLGLTREQAAARSGWSYHTWRSWEREDAGGRLPSMAQWADIARVLQVNDVYDLTGVAHAVGADVPPEHRTVEPILNAMLGIHPAAELTSPERFQQAVEDIWRCWQGNSGTRHDVVGADLPNLIVSGETAVRGTDGTHRRDLRAALASLYQLTWSYLRGVGAPNLGLMAAERSRRSAEDTDRPANIAAATWGQAAILSSSRRTEAALALCYQLIDDLERQILTSADNALLAVFGQAHLLASVQAVRLRQGERAADLLAAADRIAARTGETNLFHTAFGPLNVLMHRATAATEACRYRDAIQIGTQIDTSRSPSVERRVAHRVNLAHAYVAAKDTFAGLTVLTAACDDDTAEVRSLVLARETARQLHVRRNPQIARQVDSLLERLALAA